MPARIATVTLGLPLRMGTVNCYLLHTEESLVLIDTGPSCRRAELEEALAGEGCRPGDLKLIILTHGDFDHAGNAAYLRARHGSRIAMSEDDSGMVEEGDMFYNRSSGNALIRFLSPILYRFGKSNQFEADLPLADGDDLSEHGLEARVLSLPGHSLGSVGILTAERDLFCGDLLENMDKPAKNSIMDDQAAYAASVERLRALDVGTVYPGHGRPFPFDALEIGGQRK